MSQSPTESEPKRVKAMHRSRPDWDYFLIEPKKSALADLEKAPVFDPACTPACTKVITLLPKSKIAGHTGIGYQMINVDGYRAINAYVVSWRTLGLQAPAQA